MRVEVVLVPVSVQMGSSLRVVGFRAGDTWARRRATNGALQTARTLLDDLPAAHRHVIEVLGIEPARVAFREDPPGVVTLIYSVALPTPLADPDGPDAESWIPLLEAGGSPTKARRRGRDLLCNQPYAEPVVDHWREELEEETGLFAFLPRYFTARQARDVYSAFWGYEQDPDGFATWSGIGKNKQGGVFSEHIKNRRLLADGALLQDQVDALLGADSANKLGGTVGATLLCQTASRGAVGLWPRSSAVDATPEAMSPLQAAAALVAYQRTSRGPKPTWYERTADKPVDERLERLYAPRPAWVFAPAGRPKASRGQSEP